MNHVNIEDKLLQLCRDWSGSDALKIEKIAGSGSYRQYYRLYTASGTQVAVYNPDTKENRAFIEFTKHFMMKGLPVPAILYTGLDPETYLLEDLGDTTLFMHLSKLRGRTGSLPDQVRQLYFKAVECLPGFQVTAGDSVPYSHCYPRPAFDRQSMMWDLNYFKYYFLKLAKVAFSEEDLEEDFNNLAAFLLEVPVEHFMYRDFQSRNIMVRNGSPFFIDYQGGRKGALQYDLASLLYDAKADLPEEFRKELLDHYIETAKRGMPFNEPDFLRYFDGFVLIRILQAMGAYGFRGYYENKPLFLQSIPYAVSNLKILLERAQIPAKIPALIKILHEITGNPAFMAFKTVSSDLTVKIFSFSYKKPLPADESGNRGGFVFDCRALPNPGRNPEFQPFTGRDNSVIEFLKKEAAVDAFLNHTFALADQSVRNYIERGFTSLMIGFGCTGGRHRSVYCAEEMGKHLKEKFNISVVITHPEI